MLGFDRYEWLTFDCYGTLIDWEAGILGALRPLLRRHGVEAGDERLLELYAAIEPRLQAGTFRPYREVLRGVVRELGRQLRFEPCSEEVEALERSLPDWPVFPDTGASLRALKERYRLAVLSNIDDDLFAASAGCLGAELDGLVTALQVQSYKPAPAHFEEAMRRFGVGPGKILHVAQSLFHDVAPARRLGIDTVCVYRRRRGAGFGATPPAEARPHLEVPDLATLVETMRASSPW